MKCSIKYNNYNEWRDFLNRKQNVNFYQSHKWAKIISATFSNYIPHYVLLYSENIGLIGLPLFIYKTFRAKRVLISAPFGDYGGIIGSNLSEQTILSIFSQMREKIHFTSINLQNGPVQISGSMLDGYIGKVTYRCKFFPSEVENWDALRAKTRNLIRKSNRGGFKCVISNKEGFNDFFKLYKLRTHDLGSPFLPKSFFENLYKYSSENVKIVSIKRNNLTVAAGILVEYGNQVTIPWIGSMKEFWGFGVVLHLYWEAILYGMENGYQYFDFGRSTVNSSHAKFKKRIFKNDCTVPLFSYNYIYTVSEIFPEKIDMNDHTLLRRCWRKIPNRIIGIPNKIISPYFP